MSVVQSILHHYSLGQISNVDYLGGAGGFSGAQFWKITAANETFCLRRWPLSQPRRERLEWMNLVLVHVANQDCPFVATPLETIRGRRFVDSQGFLWELTRWMPGTASFHLDSNDERLQNAMLSLAKFHLGAAQVNLAFERSENASSRLTQLKNAPRLVNEIDRCRFTEYSMTVAELRRMVVGQGATWSAQLANLIEPFTHQVFAVQPVIRDCWHDHLLFSGNEVTGLVDFGAMQMDSVALDLARLLGSLVGHQPDRWSTALKAYSQLRPLGPYEIEFVQALDQTASLLAGLNWLKWIILERRNFESPMQVDQRIQHILGRLNDASTPR